MHEVITLQFGQQANYIGTHYWNTQESYFTYSGQDESPVNHDISFRAGQGVDGSDTYTPRALIYDLKGAFGTLRRENSLYALEQGETAAQQNGWSGRVMPLRLPTIAPSPYQQALDQASQLPELSASNVRFWSDYNHIFFHPKSIVQLNEYELNSSLMPFERHDTGEELFAELDREHDLLDRDLRPFLEECDQLQALQIFTGIDDAWGGFASKYLERVADDLGKGSRWIFGSHDGTRTSRERQLLRTINTARSLVDLNTVSSLQIPLTTLPKSLPSYVSLDGSSQWISSALQTAMIESVTLPTRLRLNETARRTYDDLEASLNNDGKRNVAAPSLLLKDPESLSGKPVNGDHRMTNGIYSDEESRREIDFLPSWDNSVHPRGALRHTHTFSSIESLRGSWLTTEEIGLSDADARDRFSFGARVSTLQSSLLFPLLSSMPKMFQFDARHVPEKLAVKASLSTTTSVADRVRAFEAVARRAVNVEDREVLCDGLINMAQEYEEGWSDDEDDYAEDE